MRNATVGALYDLTTHDGHAITCARHDESRL